MSLNDECRDFSEEEIFRFNMADFNETMNRYAQNEACDEHTSYRRSLVEYFNDARLIIIDWNDRPNFDFINQEYPLLLDLLEQGTPVLFLSNESPQELFVKMTHFMNEMYDSTGKYLSRLNCIKVVR